MTRMQAELLFYDPRYLDPAVAELARRGFNVEVLDWTDPGSAAVWVKVRKPSELDQHAFFDQMAHLAEQLGGEVVEAGLQDPPGY